MASPPNRADLAGTPTVATYKLAIGFLYDYVASLLGNGTATIATETEQTKAREYLGVGAAGFKNRFINPEFLIDQRFNGSLTSVPLGPTPKYLVDRWYGFASGAAASVQQITGIGERAKSLRFTGSLGNNGILFGQRIESFNCVDFKNKDVTVSLKAKASSAITVTWIVSYATVTDTFTTVTQIATGNLSVTTSANSFSFTFNAGANAPNGIQVTFSISALGISATADFDQFQIEKSSVTTEFQARPNQQELALCQRYYEIGTYRFKGYDPSGLSLVYTVNYKVTKRVVATLTGSTGTPGSSLNTIDAFGAQLIGAGYIDNTSAWTASAEL